MLVNWYLEDDAAYYLNPIQDGTQGQMLTGWQLINHCWYYLNPISDGTKGKLQTNTTIDGNEVNEIGQWIKNGVVVTAY